LLTQLVIQNFAIIDSLSLDFDDGLTVITGETGAGKSILVEALSLLLGGRAREDVIRHDAERAIVEGCFEIDQRHQERVRELLESQGIELEEDRLIIRRVVSRSGRNKVFVNGGLSTLASLAKLTEGFVDISGQHDHQGLTRPGKHVQILDAFGKLDAQAHQYRNAYRELSELIGDRDALMGRLEDRLARTEVLRFQLREIEQAELREGEFDEVETALGRARHAESILAACKDAIRVCYDGEGALVEELGVVSQGLQRLPLVDSTLESVIARLDQSRYLIEDVVDTLREVVAGVDSSPGLLEELEERRAELRGLQRKFGPTESQILAAAERMAEELASLGQADSRLDELENQILRTRQDVFNRAVALDDERRAVSKTLAMKVESELSFLHMEGARFRVLFEPATQEEGLGPNGRSRVRFGLATNLGDEVRPLGKIASGGELSRTMLAIKGALAATDSVPTVLFDEVDAGIGGRTADRVGERIVQTSVNHQVLCITHLPQIAARADHHLSIRKVQESGTTRSVVTPLDSDERTNEIARMLSGENISPSSLQTARDMLGMSKGEKGVRIRTKAGISLADGQAQNADPA
jgi:DNA repair protein RecN (Recombination protein N)